MKIFFFSAMLIASAGHVLADTVMQPKSDKLIEALIIGSAESPDPVLERVQELERKGIVKDVVVLESFPVQIHLKATKEVIESLNKIPRIEGNLR